MCQCQEILNFSVTINPVQSTSLTPPEWLKQAISRDRSQLQLFCGSVIQQFYLTCSFTQIFSPVLT